MENGIHKYEPLWGEWKIDTLLGKGSYGEVYKIHKDENGKRVEAAAKYISIPKSEQDKELAYSKGLATDEESLKGFFDTRADAFSKEIDLMMKLQGTKNVVRYEAHIKQEKSDGIGWDLIIRMELLAALDKYLRENSITQKEVIRLGIDICHAIECCQKEQIIHRDVKIENIFIDETGNFKLGDFGVSREAQGTTMGTITGTEDYMAPEIMKHEKYNNNVDIYSIGVVMYRLLNNNRIPFLPSDGPINDNDISAALTKRLEGTEPIPDPKFASGRLAEIIAKACAYDRHVRYASPADMAKDLAMIYEEAEDIEVLKPRKKSTSRPSTGGSGVSVVGNTVTDVSSNLASSTVTDVGNSFGGGTIADLGTPPQSGGTVTDFGTAPQSGGTVTDFGSTPQSSSAGTYIPTPSAGTIAEIHVPKQEKKKAPKWPIFAGIGVAAAALVIALVLILSPGSPQVEILGLPEDTVPLLIGSDYEFELTVSPEGMADKVTYRSSDTDIATVDDKGVITASKEGEVTIEVLVDGKLYKAVTFNATADKVAVTDIIGVNSTAQITVGNSVTIPAQVVPEDATEQKITFTSDNEAVANVGPDGAVYGVSPGQATITATADGITKTMVVTVTAKSSGTTVKPTKPPVTPTATPQTPAPPPVQTPAPPPVQTPAPAQKPAQTGYAAGDLTGAP